MKSLVDILAWVVAALAAIFAIWKTILFLSARDANGIPDMMHGLQHLWWAIGGAVVVIACVVILFVRHPHVEEEIHVTK
jgi:uncharacterized membrane protein